MTLSNDPVVPGQPVKFKLTGFPEENAIKSSLERFYALKPDADHNFYIVNTFEEQIFSGLVDGQGKVVRLSDSGRPTVSYTEQQKPE